jgi:hypothetical protein
MINVTECEFQKLVGQNLASIMESAKRMIGKNGEQAHGSGMNNGFMAHWGKCLVAMD